jgi:hypothetical protein
MSQPSLLSLLGLALCSALLGCSLLIAVLCVCAHAVARAVDGRVNLHLLVFCLAAALRVDGETKLRFVFSLCDTDEYNQIDRPTLLLILRAHHLCASNAEAQKRAQLLLVALKNQPLISLPEMFRLYKQYPRLVFPAGTTQPINLPLSKPTHPTATSVSTAVAGSAQQPAVSSSAAKYLASP